MCNFEHIFLSATATLAVCERNTKTDLAFLTLNLLSNPSPFYTHVGLLSYMFMGMFPLDFLRFVLDAHFTLMSSLDTLEIK